MTDIRIPRETAEFVPIPVYQDADLSGDVESEAVTGFQVAVTRWPARPTTWAAATVVSGKAGVAIAGLTPGTYQVWVKLNGAVVETGTIEVS